MNDTKQVVTYEEALAELGIDYADANIERNVKRVISVADAYLKGAIGENYPVDDPRAKELAMFVISDLYDNKGMKDTVSGNIRKLVDDFSLQLRLELRRATDE